MAGSIPTDLGAAWPPNAVAVVGLAGRFPGARDVRALWQLLRAGREATRWLDDEQLRAAGACAADLSDPHYVRATLPLDDVPSFDATLFGLNPRDAAVMDPQHRHFIECCWEALEDAGYAPGCFAGVVGVFGGCGPQTYFARHLLPNTALMRDMGEFLVRHTGNDKDFLTTRVSYLLDLQGPSVGVQTACSTSLVAVHWAVQSLLAGECDLALAGGASIELPQGLGYRHVPGEILSADGHCRAFDREATGTLFGSGVGVVALRRLEDALHDRDPVWAVLRATAVNNDGHRKAGYLAPSVDGQARVAAEALAVAGLQPSDIDYIEAHGTGTPLGDPIELAALSQAYGTAARGSIGLGSVKTNIGHLDTAAGVASLIKVCLALHHGHLPASLHFRQGARMLDDPACPLQVLAQGRPWPRGARVRRAAVHALGVGGTNAHVVVEEAPPASCGTLSAPPPLAWQLLPLSARSPQALRALVQRCQDDLQAPDRQASLPDRAYTLQEGRRAMACRLAVVADSSGCLSERWDSAIRALASEAPVAGALVTGPGWVCGQVALAPVGVTFMFPGAGSLAPGAGRALWALPAFAQAVVRCQQALPAEAPAALRLPLPEWPMEASWTAHPATGLPALLIVEYGMACLWAAAGVSPQAVMGHSAGEVAAACLAGLLTLEEAAALACARGQLLAAVGGGLLSVDAAPERVAQVLRECDLPLDLAAWNAPDLCLVSGDEADLAMMAARLEARGIDARRVQAGMAAHSRAVEPLLPQLQALCERWPQRPAQRPFLSLAQARWIAPGESLPAGYWVRHMREPVLCRQAFELLQSTDPPGALSLRLECGPGQALASLARANGCSAQSVLSTSSSPRELAQELPACLAAAAALWVHGLPLRATAFRGEAVCRRVSLPTYPFERQHHWIDPPAALLPALAPAPSSRQQGPAGPTPLPPPAPSRRPEASAPPARLPALRQWFHSEDWTVAPPPAGSPLAPGPWLVVGPDAAPTQMLMQRLAARGIDAACVTLATQPAAAESLQVPESSGTWPETREDAVDPSDFDRALDAVLARWQAQGVRPHRVIHLGALAVPAAASPAVACAAVFDSAVALAQAWAARDLPNPADEPARWIFVTAGAWSVVGEPSTAPSHALVVGPAAGVAAELDGVQSLAVDLDLDRQASSAGLAVAGARLSQALEAVVVEALAVEPSPGSAASAASMPTPARVAWREGRRYLPRLQAAYPLRTPLRVPPPCVRPDGVYLITGGLGDLGLALARWLVRQGATRLALVSRRAVSPPQGLQALQAGGAQVMTLCADVADRQALTRALAQCTLRWGPVSGVFHAAGELSDAPLLVKPLAAMHRLLAGKAQGAWLLHQLLPPPLDVFAVFSSTSVLMGTAGQTDYIAANAYVEALAAARPDGRVMRWGVWSDIGMAVRQAGRPVAAPARPVTPMQSGPWVHPLLGQRVAGEAGGWVFEGHWDPAVLWPLREHRVVGQPVLPGVGFLELARAAVATRHPGVPLALRGLALERALAFGDGPRIVRTHLLPLADRPTALPTRTPAPAWTCRVESRAVDATDWIRHAQVEVSLASAADLCAGPAAPGTRPDLGPAVPHCVWQAGSPPQARHPALALGARWLRVFEQGLVDGSPAARLALQPIHQADLDPATGGWAWHPALLDLGLTLAVPPPQSPGDPLYVPVSLDRACLPAALPAAWVAVCTRSDRDPRVGLLLDLRLYDTTGQALGWVQGLQMQPVVMARLQAALRADPAPAPRWLAGGIPAALADAVLDRWWRHPARSLTISSMDLPALQAWLRTQTGPMPRAHAPPRSHQAAPAPAPGQLPTPGPPHTQGDAEARVADLWRELLGVGQVGPADDFFALGGHSLLAVRLMARLRRQLGVDLPLSALLEAPTLGQLSARVAQAVTPSPPPLRPAAPAWSPLVPIQPGQGGVRPLFCVHGAGGNVLNFRLLADRLGPSVPFFGLQAQGVDGRQPPLDSIEAMAAQYLVALQACSPQGPYRLAGYSAGGVIALEMAHRLRTQGQEVELLAMIDTLHPQAAQVRLPWWQRLWWMRTWSLRFALGWAARRRRGRWVQARYRQALHERGQGRALPPELVEFHLFCSFVQAQGRYRPPLWPGPLLLFRARDAEVPYLAAGPTLGWSASVRGPIRVLEVPGSHFSVMADPGLQTLAQGLRQALARLDG